MGGGPVILDSEGLGANVPKNKLVDATIASFAAFGGILYGYDAGVTSRIQMMDAWLRQFEMFFVVSGYQRAITIGLQLANFVNNATQTRRDTSTYRNPIGIQFVWATALAVGMAFLPKSLLVGLSRSTAMLQRPTCLLALPRSVVSFTDVEIELKRIPAALQAKEAIGSASLTDCFPLRLLSGANFIFYYGTTYSKQASISSTFPFFNQCCDLHRKHLPCR
ncbi:hypothetical protein K488DRAFT_70745 [Vararia minispora EC-137]|uniref:Uncharacterized protein n=1 Tax=Vararia minispora EC-137 TaxID=1314806 RepID=A0ACB8QKG7_9AGAM|nr:hypothetical protein K488DRAFT_70745 [Vararia minispora EC-137]